MKKAVCCLLLVILSVTTTTAFADGSLEYLYYAKATSEVENVFKTYIEGLNEKIDDGIFLTEVEKALYFQYLKTLLELRATFALQHDASFSDEISYANSTMMANEILSDVLDSIQKRYEDEELSFEDAVENISPMFDMLLESLE